MSRSLLSRSCLDFFLTFFLVLLLVLFFMLMLDININIILLYNLSPYLLFIAAIIIVIHLLFCFSDEFFWKFAFLMPNEYYYYIFVKNRSKQPEKISIHIKDAKLILSKPDAEPMKDIITTKIWRCPLKIICPCSPALKKASATHTSEIMTSDDCSSTLNFIIDNSYVNEAKRIVLWLNICGPTNGSTVNIDKCDDLDIFERQFGNPCNKSWPDYLYLLLSKNVILLLARLLLLTIFFLAVLLQNPPPMMVADPSQIQENFTTGQEHFIYISAKNIGCDLFDSDVETMSFNKSLINAKFTESNSTIRSNEVKFIRLGISDQCLPGEYRGSIIITAKANRKWNCGLPHLMSNLTIPSLDLGQTYIKKLAEVPYIIRIAPVLNASVHRMHPSIKPTVES